MGREEEQVKVSILRDGGGARGGGPPAHGEDIYQGALGGGGGAAHAEEAHRRTGKTFFKAGRRLRRLVSQIPWHHSVGPKTGALSASGLRLKGGPRGHPMGPRSDMEVAPATSPNSASLGAADGAARTSSFLPLRLLWCSHRGAMWRLIGADPNACPTVIDLP